jgi:3'(2'), 5'-bisphosphate nucleotidase
MTLAPLLEQILAIAEEAGRAILEVYGTDFAVAHKDDHSPLTQADLAAHRIISGRLAALEPHYPCLSEEDADIPYATRRAWGRYWLVDPLDGTKEFVRRNGEFTVNIALIEADGAPILGVVHAPVLGTSYLAARGVGAFRIREGRREAIHTRATAARPVLVVSKSHRDAALDEFLRHAPEHEALSRGSSLKFCLVAEGSADLYPRTGPTSEWDTAAGQCVAEQAGATVCTLPDWAPLRYNRKAELLNPGFIVIGEEAYGWRGRLEAA